VTIKIKGDIQLRTFDYDDFKGLLKVFNSELGGLSDEQKGSARNDKLFSLIKKTFSISKSTAFELDAAQVEDARFIIDGITETSRCAEKCRVEAASELSSARSLVYRGVEQYRKELEVKYGIKELSEKMTIVVSAYRGAEQENRVKLDSLIDRIKSSSKDQGQLVNSNQIMTAIEEATFTGDDLSDFDDIVKSYQKIGTKKR